MFEQIHRFFASKSQNFTLVTGFLLITLIACVDYYSGENFQVDLFYFFPLFLIVWFVNVRWAIAASVLAVCIWFRESYGYENLFINIWNAFIEMGFFLVFVNLLSELKQQNLELEDLAHKDILTEIANSRFFQTLADVEINRSRRYGKNFSVAYLDIDNFKMINDNYGHNAGDAVLKMVATTIRQHIRKVDTVARLGGDEFALLFPETDVEGAKHILEKIQGILTELTTSHHWQISFSIGCVTFFSPPASAEDIIGFADKLMYSVKKSGKNNIAYESWSVTTDSTNEACSLVTLRTASELVEQ
jgi:diguanylate cyclase (GGDEF)-like protein